MLEFRKKKTVRRILYSPWMLAVLATIVAFSVRAAWNVHEKEIASREALNRATRELSKLNDREAMLANSVSALGTPQGVETEIREKFRVAKEGESVAVILDDTSSTTASSTPPVRPIWYRLLHIFGGGD